MEMSMAPGDFMNPLAAALPTHRANPMDGQPR